VSAADELVVTGPHPLPEAHPGPVDALDSLWLAVTRAGGAVGFPADAPAADVRAAAVDSVADVRAGRKQLIVLEAGPALVGTVFVERAVGPVVRHRGLVSKLMVHPHLQGRGWGTVLLDAAAAHASALGLEQLQLTTRGGTPLPAYYAGRGWTQVGLIPGALRVGPDDVRDEHWFQLRL
jgi:acetyltransferase